jgi:hypothetical protein
MGDWIALLPRPSRARPNRIVVSRVSRTRRAFRIFLDFPVVLLVIFNFLI